MFEEEIVVADVVETTADVVEVTPEVVEEVVADDAEVAA